MSQQQRRKAIRQARNKQAGGGSPEEEAKQAIAGSGASVAESLGDPVQPPAPPEPGEAPGGGQERSQQIDQVPAEEAYIGGKAPLPDDYHKVMQEEGLSHVANPNVHEEDAEVPQPQGQTPVRRGMEVKEEHPVLGALRRDFGLDSIKTEDVWIEGHKWTIGLLDAREMGLISRIADRFASTLTEREMMANYAIAAVSTRMIDDVPVYKVFGVPIPPGTIVEDGVQPPRHIRSQAALNLFEFLTEESKNKLAYTLFESYADLLDDKDQVRSYLNDEDKPRFRYKSPDADYEFVDFPNYDREGNELPYYCKYSGALMDKVAKVIGGSESPL